MKKKIFLVVLMVVALTCLLAIGVSAADMFTSSYTQELTTFGDEKPEWANVEDKDATAVLEIEGGAYVRIPAYYIFKASNNQFKVDGSNFDYGWISEKLNQTETLTNANLIAIGVPNGTTSFSGSLSESNFPALEELVIPSTVTSLGQKFLRNNTVIKKVFVKQTRNEDGSIQGVTSIPNYFADMEKSGLVSSLEMFNLELDYVTTIGSNAFMKSAVKELRFEGPITNVSGTAFSSCTALTTVYLNNTGDIITIGGKAFAYSTNLTSVTLNGFSLSDYLFENVNGLTGGLTVKATNVGKLGTMPFKNATNLEYVEISGPITHFGNQTFLGCTNLKTIKVTNTLATSAECGNNTCDRLQNLQSVEMHGISIGSYAFREISGTDMKVTLTNVGYIGEGAFYKAANITELYIEGPFTSIGSSTYRECPKLKKLTLVNTGDTYVTAGNGESNPVLEELRIEGKFNIGSPTYQNNVSLKHVYLGNGVKEIGATAFYKCYALETMYLADTITTISDRAIDMDAKDKQTSASFMFVDENGKMDNTLPTSLTYIGGHFLKYFTISNTQLIFPEGFTSHSTEQKYDFEGTIYPEGFSLVYLGKMTAINLNILYKHNSSKEITVYLTKNSASDLKGERISVNVSETGELSHGDYMGYTDGTLEIVINDELHNNINATKYIKFYFCGSNEVCFITRVNIPWGESMTKNWGNFVSTPVTYEQVAKAYEIYNAANPNATVPVPAKHPILSAPEYFDPTCTEDGGLKIFCLGCGQVASIEKTADAIGHNYDYENGTAELVSYVYENYLENGTKTVSCANCGEHENFNVSALFVCIGYSVPENMNSTGFAVKYNVNSNAIAEYEKHTGKTVSYGLFAVAQEKLGNNDILNEDGTPSDGVVKAEIPDNQFIVLELKMTGFSESQKDFKLALGVYVTVENKGETTHSYLNSIKPKDGEKYAFVSYNDVVLLTK